MSILFKFELLELPPPKKNKYRFAKKCVYYDKVVAKRIQDCTDSLKAQWINKDAIMDRVHIHIDITKDGAYPDDINMIETIYDCMETARIIKNDNLFSSGSYVSHIDKLLDPIIKIFIFQNIDSMISFFSKRIYYSG